MTDPTLSDLELDALADQVDQQLLDVRRHRLHDTGTGRLKAVPTGQDAALNAQRAVIEAGSGQTFETFWQRYLRHARKDLCLPGGMLHDQWKKWRDMESKAAVRVSYGWIAAMGIPSASLAPVAVAAAVFLINAAVNIGIDAICEGCAEAEKAEKQRTARPAGRSDVAPVAVAAPVTNVAGAPESKPKKRRESS